MINKMPKKTDKKPIITRKQKITAALLSEYSHSGGTSTENGNASIEYPENPVKADVDKNNYRVLKLPNGLTAVLISRPRPFWFLNEKLQPEEPTAQSQESQVADEEIDKNMFEKMLKNAEKYFVTAACGLSINVGSFSDSPEVPCISRILRNIFLKGSKKYSQVDSFETFLERNDGCLHKGPEHCESTSFFFKVPSSVLHEATDRFTSCFVDPILKRDWIMTERDKIEEEYQTREKYLICANERDNLFNVLATSSNKNPGNSLSANYGPELFHKTTERLWDEVNRFMKRHYSANRMVVVIEADWSLDALEDCVRKYFSRIPSNGLAPIDLNAYSYDKCFDFPAFKMMYEIETCDRTNTIEINWPMPPVHALYRSKPQGYLSWLLQKKTKGSLMYYLHERGWCTTIESGTGKSNFEDNTIYSLFSLSLVLTESGTKKQKKILDTVYSYVNFLKRETGHKRVYDEVRLFAEVKFRFNWVKLWSELCIRLCKSMHAYPSIDYLAGDFLYYGYDPKELKMCLDCMRPEKANLMICGENSTGLKWSNDDSDSDYDDEELDNYTKYSIPRDWIREWDKIAPLSSFSLPESNKFCPDDLTLVPIPNDLSPYPVKIHSDNLYEVWHRLDDKFRKPECLISLLFISNLQFQSTENAALLDLFATTVSHLLHNDLSAARVAGMKYSINSTHWGIMITAAGFNQKFSLLLQTIIAYMTNCLLMVTEPIFHAIKEKIMDEYCRHFNSCIVLADDVKHSIVRPHHHTNVEKHAAMPGIKFSQFRHFVAHYTDRVYAQALVQGNINGSDALELVRNSIGVLKCGPFAPNTRIKRTMMELDRGVRCCRVQNLAPYLNVNYVTNYYQFGEKTVQLTALIELLMMFIQDPMFNVPRLGEKLDNYGVGPFCVFSCIIGYALVMRSAIEPYPIGFQSAAEMATIDLKIENFRRSLSKILKALRPIGWKLVRKVYDRMKRAPYANLTEEMNSNWSEIASGELMFDRQYREADAIAQLKDEELCKLLVNLTTSGTNTRKLSIQMTGHANAEPKTTKVDGKHFPLYELKLLTDSPDGNDETRKYFITDIPSYRATLRTVAATTQSDRVDEITAKVSQM